MKKKQLIALTAITLGAVILSSAAIANFAASNGYSVYKESVRKIFDQDNYTSRVRIDVKVDDEPILNGEFTEQYDKATNSLVRKETTYEKTSDNPNSTYESYCQDGIRITRISPNYDPETKTFTDNKVYISNDVYLHDSPVPTFSKETFDCENDEMFDKYFNFASSCADLFVGDIKNNFVLMGTEDGFATYEANLDLFQIPEVINSGADLIVSQVKKDVERRRVYDEYDENDFDMYIAKFASNPFISGAKCVVKVDDEGRLIDNVLFAEISGKDDSGDIHKMSVTIEISFSDYGTTVPERFDADKNEVVRESDNIRTRIEELNRLLADEDLSEEDRKCYEDEIKEHKRIIAAFEKNGPIDRDKYYLIDKEVYDEEEADEVNVAVIGGADGPTEIVVAK